MKLYDDDWDWGDPHHRTMEVYQEERSFSTGLLDAEGNEIFKRPPPIGFDLSKK